MAKSGKIVRAYGVAFVDGDLIIRRGSIASKKKLPRNENLIQRRIALGDGQIRLLRILSAQTGISMDAFVRLSLESTFKKFGVLNEDGTLNERGATMLNRD